MSTRPDYPPMHLFQILPPFTHPKPEEPELPVELRRLIIALKTPDPHHDPAIVATEYNFDNEPEYIWVAYTASPNHRADVDSPVRIIFTRSWWQPASHEHGVDCPPQYLGMEFRLADGSSNSVRAIERTSRTRQLT